MMDREAFLKLCTIRSLIIIGLVMIITAVTPPTAAGQARCISGDCRDGKGVLDNGDGRVFQGWFTDGKADAVYSISKNGKATTLVDKGFLGIGFKLKYLPDGFEGINIEGITGNDDTYKIYLYKGRYASVNTYSRSRKKTINEERLRGSDHKAVALLFQLNEAFFTIENRHAHGFFDFDLDTRQLVRYDRYSFPGLFYDLRHITIPADEVTIKKQEKHQFGGNVYELRCESGTDCITRGKYEDSQWKYKKMDMVRFLGSDKADPEFYQYLARGFRTLEN